MKPFPLQFGNFSTPAGAHPTSYKTPLLNFESPGKSRIATGNVLVSYVDRTEYRDLCAAAGRPCLKELASRIAATYAADK